MKKPFLQPRLVGSRYAEASVPLEVLGEWAGFEQIVLDLARLLYLEAHPNRRRVPRGFVDGFALHLSGVGEGSAMPMIDRVLSEGREENPDFEPYYSRGRDLFLAAIAAAALQQAIPAAFPTALLSRFDKIGRSLRTDERIEFSVPEETAIAAVLNRETYKRLALMSGKREYESEAELRGQVTAFDAVRKTFVFTRINGDRIAGLWDKATKGALFDAFHRFFEDQQRVRLVAFAAHDAGDRPVRIEEVVQVELLDPLDVPARLEEFIDLDDGWLDGEGEAPPADGLAWLEASWATFYPSTLPNPYTYPTPAGGVSFEWSSGPWELSVDIDLVTRVANCIASDTTGTDASEVRLDLSDNSGWRGLADFVRKHLHAPSAA